MIAGTTEMHTMRETKLDPPLLPPLLPGDLVDERVAASILGLEVRTLRNWRTLRKGPKYRKIGSRLVRYHRADLAAFAAIATDGMDAA